MKLEYRLIFGGVPFLQFVLVLSSYIYVTKFHIFLKFVSGYTPDATNTLIIRSFLRKRACVTANKTLKCAANSTTPGPRSGTTDVFLYWHSIFLGKMSYLQLVSFKSSRCEKGTLMTAHFAEQTFFVYILK